MAAVLAVVAIVQCAVAIFQLLNQDSSGADAQRADSEMALALAQEIRTIGAGVDVLLKSVEEIRKTLRTLPLDVVTELLRSQIMGAQSLYLQWLTAYDALRRDHGVEYALRYGGFEQLEKDVYSVVHEGGAELILVLDPTRVPIVAMSAILELTSATYLSATISDPNQLSAQVAKLNLAAQRYLDWFKKVRTDQTAQGLTELAQMVRQDRSAKLMTGLDPISRDDLYAIDVKDLVPNVNVQDPGARHPCGFSSDLRMGRPTVEYYRGVRIEYQNVTVRHGWGDYDHRSLSDGGAALKSATLDLIELGYLTELDSPRTLNWSFAPHGPAFIAEMCVEGPNSGPLWGGSTAPYATKLWDGRHKEADLKARLIQLSDEESETSLNTGIQLVALAGLTKTADDMMAWLDAFSLRSTIYGENSLRLLNTPM